MKPRKEPLTSEEEHKICRECGGFCCNNYFFNTENTDGGGEFHKFRGRKFIRYGNSTSLILQDKCPYSDDEKRTCSKYGEEGFPSLCYRFPYSYRPFWNLKCKLMRVRYARGLIPKDIDGFRKLKNKCKPNKSVMKIYKEK